MTHKSKGKAFSTKKANDFADFFGRSCRNAEFLKGVLYCILCDPKFRNEYNDGLIEERFEHHYAVAVFAYQYGRVAAIGFEVQDNGVVSFLTPDGRARQTTMVIPDWVPELNGPSATVEQLRELFDPATDGQITVGVWTPEDAEVIANMVKCSSLFSVEPQYFFRA